jgi:hypothetical protein
MFSRAAFPIKRSDQQRSDLGFLVRSAGIEPATF